MTDRTNAPYDPAAAETSHEWAARVGQEHDTWHRAEGGGTTPPPTGLKPVVLKVDPDWAIIGQPNTLNITGARFEDGAVVLVSEDATAQSPYIEIPATFLSATQLTFVYTAPKQDYEYVSVRNPGGWRSSPVLSMGVQGLLGPPPVITSNLTEYPTSTLVTATITGENFLPESYALVSHTADEVTTYISPTELSVTFTTSATEVQSQVVVKNPDGGTSDPDFFNVYPTPPVLTSVTPNTIAVGAAPIVSVVGDDKMDDVGIKAYADGVEMVHAMGYPPNRKDVYFPAQAAAGTVQVTAGTAPGRLSNAIPVTITAVQEDPAAFPIDFIKEWVDDHPDFADEVLTAETARGDDARTTLLSWLQGFIAHRDED